MSRPTVAELDTAGKAERLLALAKLRQQTRWPEYGNVGDYHRGRYECDYVSPYTKSAGNVDCSVMIMLQDWASDDFLSGPFCEQTALKGRTPNRPTNLRLDSLVSRFFGFPISDTYTTNLFPFIKNDAMNAHVFCKVRCEFIRTPCVEV